MRAFEYHGAKSVSEAVGLLCQYGDKAKPLAGGTDVVIFMEGGKIAPENLVDLSRIPDLTEMDYDPARGYRLRRRRRFRNI